MSCATGKIPYPNAADAKASSYGERSARRPYRCKYCGAYHVTHLSKNAMRRSMRQWAPHKASTNNPS